MWQGEKAYRNARHDVCGSVRNRLVERQGSQVDEVLTE